MPSYSNGNVPAGLLITFASGYDDLGYWEHQWPAHTLALGNALIARAAARRAAAGLPPYALRLQTGWTAYRPLEWQKKYRAILGNGAATPGTSSHGGTFEGSQTMAGDWAWQSVYRDCGGRDAFFADCRSVGLLPGMIMASRGYPDEDWHVIDPNPWAAVPAGFIATEFLEDDMFTDQDRANITSILTALGAGDLKPGGWSDTIMGNTRDALAGIARVEGRVQNIDQQVTGADGVFSDVNVVQRLMDLKAQVAGASGGAAAVDEAAIAASLAPLIAAHVGSLSDDDVRRLSAATADELAKRLSGS